MKKSLDNLNHDDDFDWDLWEEMLEEEDEEEEENEEDEEDDDEDEGEGEPRTFNQEEVNSIMSREKKAGRRSGKRQVLEELGFASVSEAKEKLAKASDTGKPKGKNKENEDDGDDDGQDSLAAERREIALDKVSVKVERALLAANIDPKKAEKAVRLIDLEDLIDGDADDIEAAVEALEEEFPEFFPEEDNEGDEDDVKRRTKGRTKVASSHAGGKPRSKAQASASDRANRRLQERHGSKLAKSSD